MSETFLITGITGFLGSHLAEILVEEGHKVIGLKRTNSCLGRIKNLVDKIELLNVEGLDYNDLFNSQKNILAIIHTATNYGRNNESIHEMNETNVVFPLKLLESAIGFGIKVFLNTDTSLKKDLNAYAMTKYQFLNWGKFLATKEKISFINVKVEHMFGPKDDTSKFSSYLIRSCMSQVKELPLTKGEQMRDFIYVADVTSAYLTILKNLKIIGDGFHQYELGSGNAVSIRTFGELVKKLTNSKTNLCFGKLPYRDGEIMFSQANVSDIEGLGWISQYSLERGLKITIEKDLF